MPIRSDEIAPKWARDILADEMQRRYGKDDADAALVRAGCHAAVTAVVAIAAIKKAMQRGRQNPRVKNRK